MIAELLAVTVAILIVFMMIYTNFLPTLGELELRNQYNNIDSQYETFYTRVLYLKMFDENQIIETSTLATIENSPNYITLVENGTCNATLFTDVTGFNTNCNSLIEKFGIEELILTSYDLTDVKANYTGTKLKKYIKYLSSKTLNQDDINLYRLISKTDEGYATMSLYSQECSAYNYGEWIYTVNDCSKKYRVGGEKRPTNLVTNGGFETGNMNGWLTCSNCGGSASAQSGGYHGSYKAVFTPRDNWTWAQRYQNISFISGHKYYASIYAASGCPEWSPPMTSFAKIEGYGGDAITLANSTSYSVLLKSTIFTATTTTTAGKIQIGAGVQHIDMGNSLDSVLIVDLTDTFGAGNEPAITWCNSNIGYSSTNDLKLISSWEEWKNVTSACNIYDTGNCQTDDIVLNEYFQCQSQINGETIKKCVTESNNGTTNCFDGTNNLMCRANSVTNYSIFTIIGDPINGTCSTGSLMNLYRYRNNTDKDVDTSNWSFAPCPE